MSAAPLLDRELLAALEDRWRAVGAPVVDRLRPGMPDEEMDALVVPLGLRVPSEARVWWSWHDGAEGAAAFERQITGLGWKYFALADAVAEAMVQRKRATEIAGEDADPLLWRWAWLPLSDNYHGGVAAVDGTMPPEAMPTPIYYTEPELGAENARPRARSFGEMVTWWIEAFDDGVYRYDPEARDPWLYDFDRLDPQRERTRLV